MIVTKSPEECQALYSRFKSYLSLPKGIQHQVAFLAMVKDMVESESKVGRRLKRRQYHTDLHRAHIQHPDQILSHHYSDATCSASWSVRTMHTTRTLIILAGGSGEWRRGKLRRAGGVKVFGTDRMAACPCEGNNMHASPDAGRPGAGRRGCEHGGGGGLPAGLGGVWGGGQPGQHAERRQNQGPAPRRPCPLRIQGRRPCCHRRPPHRVQYSFRSSPTCMPSLQRLSGQSSTTHQDPLCCCQQEASTGWQSL